MDEGRAWCRAVVVGPDGAPVVDRVLMGEGPPDMGTVDELARLLLDAERRGGRLEVHELCPELSELLELAGLSVEVERQPEGREQPLVVQEIEEEAHPDDLTR